MLLATLHVQARGGNVSWRTLLLRDTPLAHEVEAASPQLKVEMHYDER